MLRQKLAAFKTRHAELIAVADRRIAALKDTQQKLRKYHEEHFLDVAQRPSAALR